MTRPTPVMIDGVSYPSITAAARAVGRPFSSVWADFNPERHKERQNRWRRNNPDRARELRRKWRGMPKPTRPCPPVCELCGQPPGKLALNLDHDHVSGAFRGWLCGNCNRALGLFKESRTLLRRAVAYLDQTRGTCCADANADVQ